MEKKRKLSDEVTAIPNIKKKPIDGNNSTCVSNVKVQYIRPKFHDLKEWMDSPNNEYIGRAGVVFIDGTRYPKASSKWANPFKIGKDGGRDEVISKYERYLDDQLETNPELRDELIQLNGKSLGCWCVNKVCFGCETEPVLCHGQVLLKKIREVTANNSS
jgi:hypothetical protein